MSAEPNRLRDEARRLRALANEVDAVMDRARRTFATMTAADDFTGPLADDTAAELTTARSRLSATAEYLRTEAGARDREATRLENTDSPLEDAIDLVTGRDRTPWS